jgi:hypothetical protein
MQASRRYALITADQWAVGGGLAWSAASITTSFHGQLTALRAMQTGAARYEVIKKLGSGAFGEVSFNVVASIAHLFMFCNFGAAHFASYRCCFKCSVYMQVLLGRDVVTDQLVALKKVFIKDVKDGIPECIAREIHALRAVDHPNVISLADVYPKVKCYQVAEC